MIAVVTDAADVLRDVESGRSDLADRLREHQAQLLVAQTGVVESVLHPAEQLVGDVGARAVVGEDVAAEVPHVGGRVDPLGGPGEGVFVGAVGQVGVGDAGGDRLERGLLALGGRGLDRLVGVLDRPGVVRADARLPELALRLSFRRQVDRNVVHDGAGQPHARGQRSVLKLAERQGVARFEIVPQPERVTDLVHGHRNDEAVDVVVLSLGVEAAAGLQDVPSERRFVGEPRGVVAVPQRRRRDARAGAGAEGRPGHRRVGAAAEVAQERVDRERSERGRPAGERPQQGGRRGGGLRAGAGQGGHRRDQLLVLAADAAQHVGAEADVGVEDLTGVRIDARRALREAGVRRHDPAQRRVAHVGRVPVRIVGLLLDDDGVLEADRLERRIPVFDAAADRVAVRPRDGVLQVEDDRLLGLGEQRRRVLLLEMPAGDVSHRRLILAVVGVVVHHGQEVADAVVRQARPVARLRQLRDGIVETDQQAARIGRVDRRLLDVGCLEVQDGLEVDVVGKALRGRQGAALPVELVGGLQDLMKGDGHPLQIAEEQRPEIDEHALALGVRLALDLRLRGDGIRSGQRRRAVQSRRLVGSEQDVLVDELDHLAVLVEGDDVLGQHVARVQEALAQPGHQRRVQEKRRVDLLG